MTSLRIQVNGQSVDTDVSPTTLLVDLLRGPLGLTGTHQGCDTAQCGACTVLLDGQAVKSCSLLALQAQGRAVTTVEGLARGDTPHPLQEAFIACHGLQCGFCTPGMLMSACGAAQAGAATQRRADRRCAGGQPVPLHRLREHRGCRAAGRADPGRQRREGMSTTVEAARFGSGKAVRRIEDPALVARRAASSPTT